MGAGSICEISVPFSQFCCKPKMSLKKIKYFKQKSRQWLLRAWGRKEWEVTANGYAVSFWGDENVLELDSGDICTVSDSTKNY